MIIHIMYICMIYNDYMYCVYTQSSTKVLESWLDILYGHRLRVGLKIWLKLHMVDDLRMMPRGMLVFSEDSIVDSMDDLRYWETT